MSEDCIFCKIIRGEIPCFRLYEDEHTLAFLDINPVNEGHSLVIPKRHSPNVFEIEAEDIAHVARSASIVARGLQQVLNPPGMNLVQCNGEAAQQSVMHFHMHVLPRRTGDNAPLNWPLNPGNMDELAELANRVRAAIEGNT